MGNNLGRFGMEDVQNHDMGMAIRNNRRQLHRIIDHINGFGTSNADCPVVEPVTPVNTITACQGCGYPFSRGEVYVKEETGKRFYRCDRCGTMSPLGGKP